VGNNGETLVADSSTSTGLRWQGSMAAGKNPIINGAFDVWQRGTSVALSNQAGFVSDRWFGVSTPASTTSRQSTNDTTNLPFIQYCARVQRNSGNTSTGALYIFSPLETSNAIPYAGKTITFSFYARAGANYSPTSSLLAVSLVTGTGTDQNPYTGYTGAVSAISQNATLTTTWQRFSYSATLATNATEMYPQFVMNPIGTAGANDYFEVTGVQVEVGSVATQFSRAGGTIQGELSACQRYYFRAVQDAAFSQFAAGSAGSTDGFAAFLQLPVTMRVAPTAVEWSNLRSADGPNDYGAPSSVTINTFLNNRNIAAFNVADTGLTQFRPMFLQSNNNVAAHLAVTAEL
jgi:hypothetical protein